MVVVVVVVVVVKVVDFVVAMVVDACVLRRLQFSPAVEYHNCVHA